MPNPGTQPKPTERTYRLLFAKSGNRCAYPGCPTPITDGTSLVGEAAHIKAESPNGPRYDPAQTQEERRSFENLILLCSIHHKVIDDHEASYPVETLTQMKRHHESTATGVIDPSEIAGAVQLLVASDAKIAETLVQNAPNGINIGGHNFGHATVNNSFMNPLPPKRVVTIGQARTAIETLSGAPHGSRLELTCVGGSDEVMNLYNAIQGIFTTAGWLVQGGMTGRYTGSYQDGQGRFHIHNGEGVTSMGFNDADPAAKLAIMAVDSLNVGNRTQRSHDYEQNNRREFNIQLVIGPRVPIAE